jgi:hypothetical protein
MGVDKVIDYWKILSQISPDKELRINEVCVYAHLHSLASEVRGTFTVQSTIIYDIPHNIVNDVIEFQEMFGDK